MRIAAFLLACGLCMTPASAQQSVAIRIAPSTLAKVGRVDERFQSYTIEMLEVIGGSFWKPYDEGKVTSSTPPPPAPGTESSLFQYRPPIDLTNARLRSLAKALGPAYLRVSGTWANSVYFADTDHPPEQPPAGFKGVLGRRQWRGVVDFARAVDAALVTSFAISPGTRDAGGVWTADQARRLLDYTRMAGGRIAAAEFMNEPSMAGMGGAPTGYDAAAYGRDFRIFTHFAHDHAPDMIILGPGSATETPGPWGIPASISGNIATADLLSAAGSGIQAFSYHHYGAASQRCAARHMPQTSLAEATSEEWLGRTSKTRAYYASLQERFAPGTPLWMTEGADAACGGNPWGGSFIDAFRYLDQLGRLAREGVQVSFHNTLAASNYGLLDPNDFSPKATYWTALLWHRLMGATVLDSGVPIREGLHAYAHCRASQPGGVSLLLINNSDRAATPIDVPSRARVFTLSAVPGEPFAMALNGTPLKLQANDRMPQLSAVQHKAGELVLRPRTITFVDVRDARNPAC